MDQLECCDAAIEILQVLPGVFSVAVGHEEDCPVWLEIQYNEKLWAANEALAGLHLSIRPNGSTTG